MPENDEILTRLQKTARTWLVTGGAGFIGSHLVENLLRLKQKVVVLDDLSTGAKKNLESIEQTLPPETLQNLTFINGDIRDEAICLKACEGADFVLHHAAIGSVPKSLEDPVYVNSVNVSGFLAILKAAAEHKVKRFVYASSSAVYGNTAKSPNDEDQALFPQSPYAVSKYANELYAASLGEYYNIETIGLRYFNIFGPRQNPNGPYAAVIPKWINAMLSGNAIEIYGDGETVRDFCAVEDVVRANILAATAASERAVNTVYNIASGEKTTLNELYAFLSANFPDSAEPVYKPARTADIRISCANLDKAKTLLGYTPRTSIKDGLEKLVQHSRKQR